METARLRAFIEAAEKGSIKAAADSLGYTPSAISQLVTALEKELGLVLFRRSQKGVSLTAEGEELIPLVRAYLAREDEIYRFASELNGVTTGHLKIATYPSVAITSNRTRRISPSLRTPSLCLSTGYLWLKRTS